VTHFPLDVFAGPWSGASPPDYPLEECKNMAWFTYECPTCKRDVLQRLPKRLPQVICKECGTTIFPKLKIGTSRMVEVLDNGLMAKKVERLHNVEDIMQERDAKFKKDTERQEVDDDE
jgi:DNA-directed RNA polymerase subunit RPC12/RpoP